MGAQHTPAPWWVVPYGDGDSLVIHHSEDDRVCFMATPGRRSSIANIRSNAQLIAAAPEMLDALKRALQFIRNGVEFGFIRMPDPSPLDPAHITPLIIDGVIAKAEGRL